MDVQMQLQKLRRELFRPDLNVLRKFVNVHGSVKKASRVCGVSPTAFFSWYRLLPPERAVQIEQLAEGMVNRAALLPELFGRHKIK